MPLMPSLTDRVKSFALTIGFDLVGVAPATPTPYAFAYPSWLEKGYAGEMSYLARNAEKRQDPRLVLPGARSIIVGAVNYRPPETPPSAKSPTGVVARYAHGTDYHNVLHEKLDRLLAFIRTETGQLVNAKIYVDTGPILERDLATRAGLGWYGKHTNLIHKRLGSWLLIGEILTDLTLEYDRPTTDHCGTCTRCLQACPTQAIVAPYQVDARRCLSYLTIELKDAIPEAYRDALGDRIFGCDDCQDVCPWNRRAPETDEPAFFSRSWTQTPDLVELLRWSPETFREKTKGSPVKRAKRRGLLRNVAVALGNTGDPTVVPPLITALSDEEPLVRGHAAWALGKLGGDTAREALRKAQTEETDPQTLREIDRAIEKIEKMPCSI
ncbi:MAG: tRNA epoxyqueuosine(34) reductase QueG [candidate division Zixibacteria bacterium]|nr:tRNA epoxyqueuosine(34) reductase QueG [candidate division Zixibacteria bacterium]